VTKNPVGAQETCDGSSKPKRALVDENELEIGASLFDPQRRLDRPHYGFVEPMVALRGAVRPNVRRGSRSLTRGCAEAHGHAHRRMKGERPVDPAERGVRGQKIV